MLPHQSAALVLLVNYAKLLFASATAHASLHSAAGAHLLDLAALAIGANRDAWVMAQDRGAAAARLAMVEQIIAQNFTDGQLSLAKVARHMGLSPGYLRKLLAGRGQRFSTLLMAARLNAAHAALQDARQTSLPISQIIYAVGFNDISYFNRTFRARFGYTPSDIRAMARLN